MFKQLLRELKRLDREKSLAELEWSKLYQQALKLYYQRNFDLAVPFAEKALEIARSIFSHKDNNLVASINNLAELYKALGKLNRTAPLYEEILGIYRCLFKRRDHVNLSAILNNLALVYQHQGRLADAEPLFLESLEMRQRQLGACDHNTLACCIHNLADLYRLQGQLARAEALFIEVIAMQRRLSGNLKSYHLATSLNNLGLLYFDQGKVSAATSLYVEALEIYQELSEDINHDDLVSNINNLAQVYQYQGMLPEAELMFVQAVEARRRSCSECSLNNLATSLNNLAELYRIQGRLDDSKPLFIEALEICRHFFRDRDNNDLALSINNLATLHHTQGNLIIAESLLKEALAMRRRLFRGKDNNDLALSISNLANFYIARKQLEKAFCLMIEAVEVESNVILHWFGFSTESNRLGFVEGHKNRLEVLVSVLCQYFPDDSEKIAQVAISVSRRKAFAAQAEVELNYQRYGDKYPDLAADFHELATAQGQLTHRNHTYYHHQESMDAEQRASYQQVKQALTERIEQLERKLSANVPELRQLQQHVTLPAIFAALPEHSCAIEFYHFDVYNFAGNGWQAPQYVAFILAPDRGVKMVQLGDAREIDGLIDSYRDLSRDANLPSFGARPNSASQQPKPVIKVEDISIDLQLSQRLLTPILDAIDSEIKHLIFIPDGALHTLPIGNLLVGQETRLFQKVGFLGASLGKLFVCTYLSTLRELLTRTDRPSRQLGAPIAIGNPNYDYPDIPTLVGVGTTMKSMMGQLGAVFTPIPESQLLLDSLKLQLTPDTQFFSQDRATETVLLAAKSPKLLVIITHSELLNRNGDPMQHHGLALAGANSWLAGEKLPAEIGKGFLLARDVAYLDLLGTEIVFLIACSSGLGDVKTGEGVFGLRRAFAITGVKQLITSLWDVPTRPTMLLTDRFFEAYHQGIVPAIALQTAQQYVRDISREELAATKLGLEILAEVDRLARCGVQIDNPNYPLRHPYFWGAWICQGV